ncbi:MAG: pyrroline-5-carboxylate reductase [Actinomycetota bacterium]|nr:pyrroline-5-carboxylate reductase [Actinomycetota bacterium]
MTIIDGTLAVIGGGRMGEAIISGLLESGAIDPGSVIVAEPSPERRAVLVESYGIRCVATGPEAVVGSVMVILAVKPQVMESVVADLAASVGTAIVVSIAAGISCVRIESLLPAGTVVVRVMPNTPAMVGQAMSVVSAGTEATDEQTRMVCTLFGAVGDALILDERYQDAATAISGSGPAYVALFIDSLARAGVRQGLSRDVAERLAVQTVRGTADLLEETGMHPEQLVDGVASPGGTTIAAVEALEAGGFRSAIASAVAAAVKRAKELGA